MPGNSQRKGAVRRKGKRQYSWLGWSGAARPGRKRADTQGRGSAISRCLPWKKRIDLSRTVSFIGRQDWATRIRPRVGGRPQHRAGGDGCRDAHSCCVRGGGR